MIADSDYRHVRGVITGVLFLAGCAGTPDSHQTPVVERGIPASQSSTPPSTPPSTPVASPARLPSVPAGQPLEPAAVSRPAAPATHEQPPAVVALLDRAEQQANTGELDAAAVTLERAIRIDPRNAILWHHLATIRLAEGESMEAEQLAAKSNSLAAGNHPLQARNWELIAQARHHRGDAAGARAAEQRARALESR